MAYIKYKDGSAKNIPAEQGVTIWQALHNPDGLPDEQLDRLATIQSLYLNWHNPLTPDAYIKENLDYIIPMVLNEWRVDMHGQPKKPETQAAWAFSKRWGLWEYGQPTVLVTGHNAQVFPVKAA